MSGNSVSKRPRIAVLGLGHVGLPTALGFAKMGWEVIGPDDDASKVAMIQIGQMPFYEPGLDDLLVRTLSGGRLNPCSLRGGAVRAATILFVCVGTPLKDTGETGQSQVVPTALST